MSNDFPQYCSLTLPGFIACPRKDLPWYCYMGPLGRTVCANKGYIPQDIVTEITNLPIDIAGVGIDIASNIGLIMKVALIGAGGFALLWTARTIKDISR